MFRSKGKTPPKWIIIGGSYAGALSAWFRYKFPHLVAGALSSSGVVIPLIKFDQFDQQIVADYQEDEECYKIVKNYHNVVEENLKNPSTRKAFIQSFSECSRIPDTSRITKAEFLFYFADINALYPQYSRRNEICTFVKDLNKRIRDVKGQLVEYCKKAYTDNHKLEDYTFAKLRDETIVPANNIRQWTYQYCTTYAWFQTPANSTPLRSVEMDVKYWEEYCANAIGTKGSPNVEHTNTLYAKEDIGKHATNIFFTQARNDPWRWAGMQEKYIKNDKLKYGFMNCLDCGHCKELYTEKDSDPAEVKEVRQKIIDAITQWIK
eukprot:TRINITY_DN9464_c0_g2_i1.p2 TRINITY_DN9464_c0_g2~~TRINITY_DN9464_c0_g2_i1.p2  ORF type:complete len:321 (+),score=86.15 TRINITY_DN9464_c0_g2_i1:342-1304(+)